jgi:hypothetical protein
MYCLRLHGGYDSKVETWKAIIDVVAYPRRRITAEMPSLLSADDFRRVHDLPSESSWALRIRNVQVIDQIGI